MIMEELTSPQFAAGLEKTRTALLPLGALEEHGTHLPLGTDTLHMKALAEAAAREVELFVAPALPYGLCRSTAQHPGTVSIGFDTVRLLVRDVGESLWRQGVRRLLIASGHAGASHQAALVEAGEELMARCPGLKVAVLTVVDLLRDQVADVLATPGDAHAGELETSIVLHLAPHLVRGTSPREFPGFPAPILVRNKTRFWPGGVWGDPGAADETKGGELFRRGVRALVELVRRLNDFEEPES
ncbi:MAG: creatininase family protein [Thermodesulfobacteriota bacterium]